MVLEIRQSTAQQIVDSIKEVCQHNINFIDRQGRIIASTDERRIGDFHEIGAQVVRTGQTIEVETDNSFFGTHRGVNIPIIYNHEVIAAVGLTGQPAQVRRYAQLAEKITKLLLREQELEARERSQQTRLSHVVRSLATHLPIQKGYAKEVLEEHQIHTEGLFCTIVAQSRAGSSLSRDAQLEQVLRDRFRALGIDMYCFEPPREHLVIVSEGALHRCLEDLHAIAQTHALMVGIGMPQPLMEQHKSYTAARIAFKSLSGSKTLALFQELDLDIVLGTVPPQAQHLFVEKVLRRLGEKDLTLLQTYYACDMSLKKTCEALYLHKNTLQYQMDRIGRISGYNPRCFQDAAVLYTALKLNGWPNRDEAKDES